MERGWPPGGVCKEIRRSKKRNVAGDFLLFFEMLRVVTGWKGHLCQSWDGRCADGGLCGHPPLASAWKILIRG